MTTAGSIEYVFSISDDGTPTIKKIEAAFKSSMGEMERSSKRTTSDMESGWGRVKTAMSGGWSSIYGQFAKLAATFVSLYGAMRLLQGAWNFLKESVKAAEEQEKATTKMNVALANAGFNVRQVSDDFVQFSQKMMVSRGVADEVVQDSLALISTFGGTAEEIKQASAAAIDLSSVFGIDMHSASMIMGKAIEGNVKTLQRMGIQVDAAAMKTQGFQAVIDKLASVQGQAEAQARTFGGTLGRLTLSWNELKESMGMAVTQNYTVRAAMQSLIEEIYGETVAIDGNRSAWQDLVSGGVEFFLGTVDYLFRVFEVLKVLLSVVALALVGLADAFIEAARGAHFLMQASAGLLNILPQVREGFTSWRKPLDDASAGLQSTMGGIWDSLKSGVKGWWNGSDAVNKFTYDLKKNETQLKLLGNTQDRLKVAAPRKGFDWSSVGEKKGSEKKEKEDKWEVPKESGAFWQEYAALQTQYRSPKSTFKEQDEAFKRLQEMYKHAQSMTSTYDQKIKSSWQAFSAGARDACSRANTYLQSMSDFGSQTFDALGNAFANSFSSIMKGDFKNLGGIWKEFLKTMLNAFINTIAQMMAQWLMFKLVTFFFGGFGMAQGGVFAGHFVPLKAFATGGIASSPTLGMIAETGKPEAVVPLPDGRSIPVQMRGDREKPVQVTIMNVLDPVDVVGRATAKAPHLIINPVVADYQNRGSIQKIMVRGGR